MAALLILLTFALAIISHSFGYTKPASDAPVFLTVLLLIISCGVMVWGWAALPKDSPHGPTLFWIIIVGLVLRGIMMFSQPILETDFYRYLWDGAVTANGYNPYTHSPEDAMENRAGVSPGLAELADQSGLVIERVNHPGLRTIYPPVAQAGFALAHWIQPWGLNAWRMVILIFDSITLILLIRILSSMGRPMGHLVIYWWNPLMLKEFYNSAHMDIMVLPFALAAIYLCAKNSYMRSAIFLALAMAAKLWPAILGPGILAGIRAKAPSPWRTALFYCLVAGSIVALMAVPVIMGGLDSRSGFTAYTLHWEMNDGLYMLFYWGFQWLTQTFLSESINAHTITRLFTMGLLSLWIIFLIQRGVESPEDLWDYCLAVTAFLFLVSPTEFPWYYSWVIPFLAIRPLASLLLLNSLLPIYYLRFHFSEIDNVWLYDNLIVWAQYGPVILVLAWEIISGRLKRQV